MGVLHRVITASLATALIQPHKPTSIRTHPAMSKTMSKISDIDDLGDPFLFSSEDEQAPSVSSAVVPTRKPRTPGGKSPRITSKAAANKAVQSAKKPGTKPAAKPVAVARPPPSDLDSDDTSSSASSSDSSSLDSDNSMVLNTNRDSPKARKKQIAALVLLFKQEKAKDQAALKKRLADRVAAGNMTQAKAAEEFEDKKDLAEGIYCSLAPCDNFAARILESPFDGTVNHVPICDVCAPTAAIGDANIRRVLAQRKVQRKQATEKRKAATAAAMAAGLAPPKAPKAPAAKKARSGVVA